LGAIRAAKGEATTSGPPNSFACAEAPPFSARLKCACSGTQISLQTSQFAVAVTLLPDIACREGQQYIAAQHIGGNRTLQEHFRRRINKGAGGRGRAQGDLRRIAGIAGIRPVDMPARRQLKPQAQRDGCH
jgi:hypothetical protein